MPPGTVVITLVLALWNSGNNPCLPPGTVVITLVLALWNSGNNPPGTVVITLVVASGTVVIWLHITIVALHNA